MALKWIHLLPVNCTVVVAFQGVRLSCTLLRYSVPQVSHLRPLLFLLYTAEVAAIGQEHDTSVHSCIDDTELYMSCFGIDGLISAAQRPMSAPWTVEQQGLLRFEARGHMRCPNLALLFMAAQRSRCGHYMQLWFLSFFFFFLLSFSRLISPVADWMSTIILHMVWP